MRRVSYPLCCTHYVLYDFGGSVASDGTHRTIPHDILVEQIFSCIENSTGILFTATTTTQQTEANKALNSMGFLQACPPQQKRKHTESKLILWYKPTNPDIAFYTREMFPCLTNQIKK